MQTSYILISACLLGEKVRYDGGDLLIEHPILKNWMKQDLLISICPEVSGGLPIPRSPAEIQQSNNNLIKIVDIKNADVTTQFCLGAKKSLRICQSKNIKMAILTENSPSCGSSIIYDGSFQGKKISGEGITTKLLRKNGIKVFNQNQLEEAYNFHRNLHSTKDENDQ